MNSKNGSTPPPSPPDGEVLLTVGAAAAFIGCSRGRIERAVLRARVPVCGRGERGQPFFRKRDVKRLKEEFEAEDRENGEEQ